VTARGDWEKTTKEAKAYILSTPHLTNLTLGKRSQAQW
jgi:hypothetical protein